MIIGEAELPQPDRTGTVLVHRADCERPDVHTQSAVTKSLRTCRNCGAEVLIPKATP